MTRPRQVGMAWYGREDYPRIRAMMEDGSRLPESFDAWRISAEQVAGEVERSGVAVIRVPVEPDAFARWCTDSGVVQNGAARTRYATERAGTGN